MFEDNRNHRLRRLIVELAGYHREDMDAILDVLSPPVRHKVETLLREYRQIEADSTLRLDPPATGFDASRFSPWLVERLSASPISEPSNMTDQARTALRSCAMNLFPLTNMEERATAHLSPSLLSRMRTAWSSLMRGAT